MKILHKSLALFLSCSLSAVFPGKVAFASQTDQSVAQAASSVAKQSEEELQQLVAPIALYPDALVSQILAGATYPTEIVEADRWVQEHPNLKGKDLADEVDKQPWVDQHKGTRAIPLGTGERGQEPVLDVRAWGGLCKPATRCNGRPASHAHAS